MRRSSALVVSIAVLALVGAGFTVVDRGLAGDGVESGETLGFAGETADEGDGTPATAAGGGVHADHRADGVPTQREGQPEEAERDDGEDDGEDDGTDSEDDGGEGETEDGEENTGEGDDREAGEESPGAKDTEESDGDGDGEERGEAEGGDSESDTGASGDSGDEPDDGDEEARQTDDGRDSEQDRERATRDGENERGERTERRDGSDEQQGDDESPGREDGRTPVQRDSEEDGDASPSPAGEAARAAFRVLTVSLSNTVVDAGEQVEVAARVENTGDREGRFTARLFVDGTAVETDAVRLGAGQAGALVFEQRFDESGEYEITVGDTAVETVTVTDTSGSEAVRGERGDRRVRFWSSVLRRPQTGSRAATRPPCWRQSRTRRTGPRAGRSP